MHRRGNALQWENSVSADRRCASPGVIERFREGNETFPKSPEILSARARGQKVMGWVCTYVPEDLPDLALRREHGCLDGFVAGTTCRCPLIID